MAFNIIAETNKKLDFNTLHKEIYSDDFNFDFVPMPEMGINGGDAMYPTGQLHLVSVNKFAFDYFL